MYHRLIRAIAGCLLTFHLQAQNSVFVLVDVSGSGVEPAIKLQARDIVKDILNGQYTPSKYDPIWKWSPVVQAPLNTQKGTNGPILDVSQNPNLMIMPFGLPDRYKEFKIGKIDRIPDGVNTFFSNHYPTVFSDAHTYREIAKAKAVGVAKSIGIDTFYLIEVTDALQDTDSQRANFSPEEWRLIQTNLSTNTTLGELCYNCNANGKHCRILFSRVILQRGQSSNIISTPVVPGTNTTTKEISMVKPTGTLKKPTSIDAQNAVVIWQCLGCTDSTEFSVSVVNTKDAKIKFNRKTRAFNAKFNLTEPGVYKVSVNGDGIGSKITYFNVGNGNSNSGGSGGFLWILVLLFAVGAVYYLWSRQRSSRTFIKPDNTGGYTGYQPPSSSKKNEDNGDIF